jgi:hypothetical protein
MQHAKCGCALLVQGFQDDDDYFRSIDEAAALCVPEIPASLNSESDSIDLDDVPCVVPDSSSIDIPAAESASGEEEERRSSGRAASTSEASVRAGDFACSTLQSLISGSVCNCMTVACSPCRRST